MGLNFSVRRRIDRAKSHHMTEGGEGYRGKDKLLMSIHSKFCAVPIVLVAMGFAPACFGQQISFPGSEYRANSRNDPTPEPSGSIRGTIIDQSGALVAGAKVKITEDQSPSHEALSSEDGQFAFTSIVPGPFQLTISSAGFETQTFSGILNPGEIKTFPLIALAVATNVTEVQVGLPRVEVAEEQIKIEEKQRVLGAIPNFYVSYIPDAAPLNSKQKFKLAARTVVDPFTFAVVAGTAGVQQAQNHFNEYGQGAEGYAKRFGAGYADTVSSTFIAGAILPSLFKQDPRYFYKGNRSVPWRFLYAIANAVICKGDNGLWQPNYSNMLGNLAAGAISNLYYPANDRNGAGLTFENAGVGIGATAVTNVLQEFVIRKLTPKAGSRIEKP
jgi:Carboxypeptidase regulatory-like domain